MSGTRVDLDTWARADQYRFFRTFERPHFNTTARIDVTQLMAARKERGLSPFRHVAWAIGAGLYAVEGLRMRFEDENVWTFKELVLSSTVLLDSGDLRFSYIDYTPDRAAFDAAAAGAIAAVKEGVPLNPHHGTPNIAYLSCLPWLDFTALDHALPHANDCIPRVSWGKIVPKGEGYDVAMNICVHHALVDGHQVGAFYEAVQEAVNAVG